MGAPDDPADAGVDEAVLMEASVSAYLMRIDEEEEGNTLWPETLMETT